LFLYVFFFLLEREEEEEEAAERGRKDFKEIIKKHIFLRNRCAVFV